MTFRVGQKVVCINDDGIKGGEKAQPIRGRIYTVRGYDEHVPNAIYLVEVVNKPRQWRDFYGESSWWAWRFRPVVERKTNIEIFTKMLTDKTVEVVR